MVWDLIWPHRERLLRVARARGAARDDAEDCVHDAMLRCATTEGVDPERIGALLTTLTLHAWADTGRARSRALLIERRLAADRGVVAEPGEAICERAEARWLAGQMYVLRPRERDVLVLRASGLSTADAARELGVSAAAAASALTRARRRFAGLHDLDDRVVVQRAG